MAKIIKLSGVVGWDILAENLEKKLPKNGDDVLLKVDSVGGSVFEGYRLYNLLKDYPGNIKVELGVMAASAASYFPLAVGVENISVYKNTTFMIHKAWSFAIGNADEMQTEVDILNGLDKIIAEAYIKALGEGDLEEMLQKMKDELWLIGGEAVVEAGFASNIVESDEYEEEDEQETVDKTVIKAKIKEAKNILRSKQNQEDLNKWAAKIHEFNNSIDIAENENQSKKIDKKSMEAFNMDLNEYLEKNPDAKATIENEKKAAIDIAVNEDRSRFAEVLALSGVAIPENILNSAKQGKTVEEFAVAELKARNAKLANLPKEETELGKLSTENQLPKAVVGEDQENNPIVAKLDAAIDEVLKKGDK